MDKKFKILSLDGGGVRGYLTIMILENVEKQLNARDNSKKPIGEYFDLIAGTSTGAIIGGLLAIGKSASEVRKIYEDDIKEIFSDSMQNKFPFNLFRAKYSSHNLTKKAEEHFEDLTFKDVTTDLLVTSVDITTMTPRFYKSAYNSRNTGRVDEKLSDAIVASASAPTFFPVKQKLEHSSQLIDGGVVANNPSLVALIDAFSFEDKPNQNDIVLLSVGTGKSCELPYDAKALNNTTYKWLRQNDSSPLIEILMNSQSTLAEFQTSFMMKHFEASSQYLRINPLLSSKVKLDDAKNIDVLKNIADLQADTNDWVTTNL